MKIKELKESGQERKQSVVETREHLPISDAIPERTQTAEALFHERERLAAIINGTNIGTWEWNIQTGETIFNNRWAEIIGYTLDELAPVSIETWMKFAHPDDLQLSGELLERHFRGDLDYYECESRMKHKSGDWVWVLDRGKVASWTEDGKPLLMFGTHLDLTARKQAEEVLRQSEELHRTTLQTAMDGFWMADTQGRLLEVNETYSRMSGYSLEELRAMCIPDLEVVETATDTADHMQKLMAQGEDRFETRHRRKDGSIFPIEISVQYHPIGGGRMVAFLRDITENKLTEQTLRRQREELSHVGRLATVGEFAASIAHEIHQPLTAILNNAQAAQRFLSAEIPEIAEVQEAIQDIIADDRRAAEVIRHLRLFLKREEADRTLLDINSIIGEVLTMLHGELQDRNVLVTPDLNPGLPHVQGGRIELQQVLMNLILNGCDAMIGVDGKQRRIRIKTSVTEPDSITIAVQDSGTGLADNAIDRVFEHFYTTKRDGLGIGLPISRSIIAAHGGRIWAANNPDGGATFYFTLPITEKSL